MALNYLKETGLTNFTLTVDDPIAQMFAGLIQMTLAMVIKFLAVVILTPAFLLPGAFVGLSGAWCGNIYIKG